MDAVYRKRGATFRVEGLSELELAAAVEAARVRARQNTTKWEVLLGGPIAWPDDLPMQEPNASASASEPVGESSSVPLSRSRPRRDQAMSGVARYEPEDLISVMPSASQEKLERPQKQGGRQRSANGVHGTLSFLPSLKQRASGGSGEWDTQSLRSVRSHTSARSGVGVGTSTSQGRKPPAKRTRADEVFEFDPDDDEPDWSQAKKARAE